MKTPVWILFLSFMILSGELCAQNYAFKVLANKGSNEVKSADGWQPLRTGASLQASDELKLADNSYIGLVHASGKPVELKEARIYKVSELASQVKGGATALNKYTDFILSSNSAEAKKNKLSATGAVHRDVKTASAIKLLLPPNQHSGIYNNTAIIKWEAEESAAPYIVTLRNMFDDELAKIETSATSLEIDLGDPKYAAENAILVEVTSKANPRVGSQQHLVKKLTPADYSRVKKSLSEIIGEVAEKTALNKFILAGFYEENTLFIDAIAAYEEAIKLAPDVPFYQEAYEEFLLRHGLKN